jgi:hypothetical protein
MRRYGWAFGVLLFVGCSSAGEIKPDHVVGARVCYVGELQSENPLVPIQTEDTSTIESGPGVNEAVIFGILVHPDLLLPSQGLAVAEISYLDGCFGAMEPREFGFREFAAHVNWRLSRTGRALLYLPDHIVTLRSIPSARLVIVTVNFMGVDPSAPRIRNFVVDLGDVPGAFDPSIQVTTESLENRMKVFQGGLG